MEITYDSIRPYLLEETMENSSMLCKFKIEDQVFDAKGFVRVDNKSGAARVTRMVKTTAIGRLRSMVLRTVRQAVGGGFAGTTASMVGNEMMRQQTEGVQFSRKDKEAAVVNAFESIAAEIYYDNDSNAWRVNRELSEFELLLRKSPIEKPYDKKVLARLLVEMARADGTIEAEEKEFFSSFLSEETGNLGQLMRAPAISFVECEEIGKDVQQNVFMITAAVALADDDFSIEEQDKLEEYAEMFEFSEDKRKDLLRLAQDYTIENIVKTKGAMTRDDLYALADRLGMDRNEAERTQIRLEKRMD